MTAQKKPACTVRRINVTSSDLPLSCPMDGMRLWDAHPKVYLPITKTGYAMCPYCGTEYFLKAEPHTEKTDS